MRAQRHGSGVDVELIDGRKFVQRAAQTPAAALQGRELHADPNPEQGEYYRSDNLSFARAGVPALFAIGGVDDSARGPLFGQAQLDDYRERRYHQPGDVYSPDWDVRGTLDDLNLYYRIGMRLAQMRRFPNWYRTSEFRNAQGRGRETDAPAN